LAVVIFEAYITTVVEVTQLPYFIGYGFPTGYILHPGYLGLFGNRVWRHVITGGIVGIHLPVMHWWWRTVMQELAHQQKTGKQEDDTGAGQEDE